MRALLSAMLVWVGACASQGSYVTDHGTTYTGNIAWQTQASAEAQELQAADILSRQLYLDRASLLTSIAGTVGYGKASGDLYRRDGSAIVGLTHLNETPIRIEVAEGYGAMCAIQGATWRHEVAHVMLFKAGVLAGDAEHVLPIWDALNEWTIFCF